MVYIIPVIGAGVLLSGFVSALPKPDSAIGNEVAVSAPNGTPISDTTELASQTASMSTSAAEAVMTSQYSSNNYQAGDSKMQSSGWSSSSTEWSSSSMEWSSTSTAHNSYSSPSYGSGKSNWGGSGYDDCVNKCIASYGAPAGSYQASSTGDSSGSQGSGATHTVIVAPTQGVLRYVPFAVNASVGDTVKFMWGANNHTVTKSSELTPCNKTEDSLFLSGTQNQGFVFTQVVNDTNPTFFYCGTPGHCQKGMFGIINPPNALGAPSSVSGMMSSWASNDSGIAAMAASSTNQTAGNDKASTWGGSIDVSSLPDWSHSYVAENVMYTRNFLAANPEVINDNGVIDLSAAGGNPLMIPQDITAALNNAASSSSSSATATASGTAATAAAAAASTTASKPNGASSMASPRILVGIMAVVATLFVL